MSSGQNPPISIPTRPFSFSKEVKVSLSVVLACHLLLLIWIGLGKTGTEPESDITPPMTGILLSTGSGTGTGAKGSDTGTPKADHSLTGMEKETTENNQQKKQTFESQTASDTKPVKNISSSALTPPQKNSATLSGSAASYSAASAQPFSSTASGTTDGNARATGNGNGTNKATGSGKGSGGISAPYSDAAFFSNPKPAYPAASRRMGEEGTVLLSIHIQADGKVNEVKLKRSSGFSRLDDSAIKTVRHWRYLPARRNGKPIPFWYSQPIRFSLDD